MIREYIRDSLILLYDTWFRPERMQLRLNEWVSWVADDFPLLWSLDDEGASWLRIILSPDSKEERRVLLLCLPWWLAGLALLWLSGEPTVPMGVLLLVGLGLVAAGWIITAIAPPLGLVAPALLAAGWSTGLQSAVDPWTALVTAWQSWLTLDSALLSALILLALAGGFAAVYVLLRRGNWRWARIAQGGAGVIVSLLAGLLAGGAIGAGGGIAAGLTTGAIIGFAISDVIDKESVDDAAAYNATLMAAVIAVVVLVVVAISVVNSVVGGMAGGVVGGVAGLMALAFVVIAVVSLFFALDSIPVVVMIIVATVVAVVMVVGLAGLALLPPPAVWLLVALAAMALGRYPRWWGALLVAVVVIALRVENAGWMDATMTFGLALMAYYRLPLALGAWASGLGAYRRAIGLQWGGRGLVPAPSALRVLRGVPPFADEMAWVHIPYLDRLLVLAAREDLRAGLRAVQKAARSRYQAWAAPRAYVQIAADAVAQYTTLEQVAGVARDVTWLPEDLSTLPPDVGRVWPRLLALGRDVATAQASDSTYNRRLGMSHAREELIALRQQLPALGKIALERWQPVVQQWDTLLGHELERPLLESDVTVVNPYEAGNPLTLRRAALFRGRRDLAQSVASALWVRNRPTLVLHGQRRTGKTSFLLQLPRLLPGRIIPVFVDLQRPASTESTWRFLHTVARAIVIDARTHSQVALPEPEQRAFERDPFGAFGDWLDDAALPRLEQSGGFALLLNLDEFEKLGQALSAGRVEARVLDELRHTIQHRQAVSLLFSGVQTLDELGPQWSSYFVSVRPVRIGYLLPDEAADLVRHPDPDAGFSLEYTDEAVADILAATRCHPYLVQLVCSTVVDLANERRTLLATPDLLAEAHVRVLERGEPYFRNLWDEVPGADEATIAAGRRILRQVAVAVGPSQIKTDTPDVARALERLLRYGLLEQVEGGIQFGVPLVRRWVQERAPIG